MNENVQLGGEVMNDLRPMGFLYTSPRARMYFAATYDDRWRNAPDWKEEPLYTASQLVKLKDHQIAQLTNELRDTAIKYRDAQQLRERIAMIIRPLFKP